MAVATIKSDALSSVTLFTGCTRADLRRIVELGAVANARAGRQIVQQGRHGRTCYVILEGEADVIRSRRRIAQLGPGDAFGELALLYRGPRSATVVTTTPVQMLVLERQAFGQLLVDIPEIARKVLATMAQRLVAVDKGVYG
jgi:CRP/FNR family cyclic AMP-dependent transcriptional regulator